MIRCPRNRPPTHPGVHLRRAISRSEFSREEVAGSLGVSLQRLTEIICGRVAITPHLALRLEEVTRVSSEFWLSTQSSWDLWHEVMRR